MSKIKKILLILSAVLSLGYFVSVPALAAPTATDGGGGGGAGNTNTTSSPCDHAKSNPNPKVTCEQCQPTSGNNPPALCACYPEYNFGSALTPAEQSACEVCQNAGLNYDVTTDQGKSQLSQACLKANPITNDVNVIVNVLAALATIAIIGTLIAGGIQYAIAGSPQAAQNARKRVTNGLLALAALFFIWAFLQWLIPGGV